MKKDKTLKTLKFFLEDVGGMIEVGEFRIFHRVESHPEDDDWGFIAVSGKSGLIVRKSRLHLNEILDWVECQLTGVEYLPDIPF